MTERLLKSSDMARKLNICRRTLFRMNKANKVPAPLEIYRGLRWVESEVDNWILAGCPEIKFEK